MINVVVIEKINESDLDSLSALYRQLGGKESNKEEIEKVFHLIDSNPDYYLLGIKNETKLVGSAFAIICNDLYYQCKPFMVIENVIVDEKHQRRGYGTILFEKIEQIAKKHKCYFIMLLSNKKRNSSHKFYRKLGYIGDESIAFKKYLL
nr:GNAT family N-acetyltransferase [Sporosalibacterium faouarense]